MAVYPSQGVLSYSTYPNIFTIYFIKLLYNKLVTKAVTFIDCQHYGPKLTPLLKGNYNLSQNLIETISVLLIAQISFNIGYKYGVSDTFSS